MGGGGFLLAGDGASRRTAAPRSGVGRLGRWRVALRRKPNLPRKAKNLARDSHCVIAARREALDLVVEGTVAKVSDEARLHRVAEVYMSEYGWPVTVREGAPYGDDAPTAGPPPYEVSELTPTTAFAFPWDETYSPTSWRF